MSCPNEELDDHPDDYQLAILGASLNDEDINQLEKQVQIDPSDITSRIKLLGNYFLRQQFSEEIDARRMRHIEFMIKNHPERKISGSAFIEIFDGADVSHFKVLWMNSLNERANDPVVHLNAAHFFGLSDKDFSEKLFLEALEIDPEDRRARLSLAQFYQRWEGHEQQAIVHFEQLSDDVNELNYSELNDLPKAYFAAGENSRAIDAANKLLRLAKENKNDWNYGNAINKAHTVLGMIAINSGEIKKALKHLSQSYKDIATPQTTSFGPSTDLVKLVAKLGYTKDALRYLDEAQHLCGYDGDKYNKLRYEIAKGRPVTDDATDVEDYEDFVRKHVMKSLRKSKAEDRVRFIEHAITSTESSIRAWSNSSEKKAENLEYQKLRVEKLKGHLRELQLLSEENH